MLGIGIVGVGNMGSVIARAIDRAEIPASLVGVDRTRVTIVADPALERNIHEVEVVGDSGC